MEWYDDIKEFSEVKKQGTPNNDFEVSGGYDYKHQDRWDDSFSDALRYTFDSYYITIAKSKTDERLSVGMVMNHSYLGSLIYNQFWTYDVGQEAEAEDTFLKAVSATKEEMERFVREEIPTNILHSYLRSRYRDIDPRGFTKTNIPFINYSYDLESESDWRSQIYGSRYIPRKEYSFTQMGEK